MKLEFKHIAPYLPYELKWSLQELSTFTMTGATKETLYTKEGSVLNWANHDDLPQALFPMLRPLSYLTEEIEVNGYKFIPIVELWQMYEAHEFRLNDIYKLKRPEKHAGYNTENYNFGGNDHTSTSIKHVVETTNIGDLVCDFRYDWQLKRFASTDTTRRINHAIAYQYELFQKLFEWYFDVNLLIPNGLAIDINTLKQNT